MNAHALCASYVTNCINAPLGQAILTRCVMSLAGAAGFEPATYGFGGLNKAVHPLHRFQVCHILLGLPKRVVGMVLMNI